MLGDGITGEAGSPWAILCFVALPETVVLDISANEICLTRPGCLCAGTVDFGGRETIVGVKDGMLGVVV